MKNLLLFMSLAFFFIACSDEKKYSNDEADTRDHNMERKTESGDRGILNDSAATSTSNNNAYNTDSASGQGNRFDTSNNKAK